MQSAPYTVGIEEEFFVIDRRSRNLRRRMSKKFFRACQRLLDRQVTGEMLQCQIEAMTPPCSSMAEARDQLVFLRKTLVEEAARYDLGILAASTHPIALWHEQHLTEEERYAEITGDVQITGLRSLLCGMHVHVEVSDLERRVDLMRRIIPFLPVLLALSTSSPFWQGRRTGLAGYRQAAHKEMPRTGPPELFKTGMEYECYASGLVRAGAISDGSHIWWDIRPSIFHPTLELRITDVCTRIEDAICIAALYRCLIRRLCEDPTLNADIDAVDRAFAEENKWRAERFGTTATLIERRSSTAQPLDAAVEALIGLLRSDAAALGCVKEIEQAAEIVTRGSSATGQVRVYERARLAGLSKSQALKDVVDWLVDLTALSDPRPAPWSGTVSAAGGR